MVMCVCVCVLCSILDKLFPYSFEKVKNSIHTGHDQVSAGVEQSHGAIVGSDCDKFRITTKKTPQKLALKKTW